MDLVVAGLTIKDGLGAQQVPVPKPTAAHIGMCRRQVEDTITFIQVGLYDLGGEMGSMMKNIQVIDGANNCTYDIYAATDDEFDLIFPAGTDVEFIEDAFERIGEDRATTVMAGIWKRLVNKKEAHGIHGTLFCQLEYKRRYYPTKKEAEAVALGKGSWG